MVQNFAQKQIILLAGMTKTFIDTSDQHDENDKNKKNILVLRYFEPFSSDTLLKQFSCKKTMWVADKLFNFSQS